MLGLSGHRLRTPLMPRLTEWDARKRERQDREARAIRPDMLTTGKCQHCGERMVQAVVDYDGCLTHPSCDPRMRLWTAQGNR